MQPAVVYSLTGASASAGVSTLSTVGSYIQQPAVVYSLPGAFAAYAPPLRRLTRRRRRLSPSPSTPTSLPLLALTSLSTVGSYIQPAVVYSLPGAFAASAVPTFPTFMRCTKREYSMKGGRPSPLLTTVSDNARIVLTYWARCISNSGEPKPTHAHKRVTALVPQPRSPSHVPFKHTAPGFDVLLRNTSALSYSSVYVSQVAVMMRHSTRTQRDRLALSHSSSHCRSIVFRLSLFSSPLRPPRPSALSLTLLLQCFPNPAHIRRRLAASPRQLKPSPCHSRLESSLCLLPTPTWSSAFPALSLLKPAPSHSPLRQLHSLCTPNAAIT